MLALVNVTKKYGSFTALEDLCLSFENGVYGLLSPNGAGKTTLIKMLTTLLFPTKGQILWQGEDILALDERYRAVIGYLPQDFGYYRNYSPRRFLAYLAILKGLDRSKAARRIDELLEMVSLSEVRDTKMRKFSGGMLRRVGIAQAMLGDPKILILDEPTSGLDPKERVRFRNIISGLSDNRIVILSTHIVSDIETIADKIVMLRDRRLLYFDSPAAIIERLSGRVYEVSAGTRTEHLLLAEKQYDDGKYHRILVEDGAPPEGAKAVSPNLEDAFLDCYR